MPNLVNSRGFSDEKKRFCNFLLSNEFVGNKIPILVNQENFVLRGNCYKIRQALPQHHTLIKPAVKETFDHGRGKNGMFIAVPKYLSKNIEDISPLHWRIQAAILTCGKSKVLIVNAYFPVDNKKDLEVKELEEVLESIRSLICGHTFDILLMAGDMNADFTRQTGHCRHISSFLQEYNLQRSWSKYNVDYTHYQEIEGISTMSTIDHFFWNDGLDNLIEQAGVYHSIENFSDHSPIYCCLKVNSLTKTDPKMLPPVPKPKWNMASNDEKLAFRNNLNNKLTLLEIPSSVLECRDLHCKSVDHRIDVDNFMISILNSVEIAAFESIPVPTARTPRSVMKAKTTPGWNEFVRPAQETARFWNAVWSSAGKPVNCELHSIMKKTRNIYHYQVRRVKKSKNDIRKHKLLDACLNGDIELFGELKKMRGNNPQVASSIDGVDDNISEHFKGIYEKLYNSVDDKDEVELLRGEIDTQMNSSQLYEVNKVIPSVIKQATSNLSDGKSDPIFSYSSDCFKNGTDLLFELLAIAFQCYLVHGHFTLFSLLATLIPIIKDKLGNMNSSKNYRSIAISSLTLKIFDWIILILYGDLLGLDDLQFAYQQGCSTTMCSWSVIETIEYFKRNGSDVFACCMDMSKAFDLVRHSILFRKLLAARIPLVFLRLLLFIYLQQYANVKWNGGSSEMFSLSNGVRQGGVISAILYCFYVNSLFSQLRRSGYGCWINGVFTGIYGYSDDNLLLAPSIYALQKMLNICESFAESHGLIFSTDTDPAKCKTKCIAFTCKQSNLVPLRLCGNDLPWVNAFKHLGNTISNESGITDSDVNSKRAQFISKCMELEQEFYFATGRTRFKLNSIYNLHFTGSPIWYLFGKPVLSLESSYNRSVKQMFSLPLETHRSLIEHVTGQPHLRKILVSRFFSFLEQINRSKKSVPKMLLHLIRDDTRSVTGANLRKILSQTDKLQSVDLVKRDAFKLEYHPLMPEDMWKSSLINELVGATEEKFSVPGFSDDEVHSMINHLCIN